MMSIEYIIGCICISVIANYIYFWLSGKSFLSFLSWNKDKIINLSLFDISKIKSSLSNCFKIESDVVMWECGTIMCWVYVNPCGEGIRELNKHR